MNLSTFIKSAKQTSLTLIALVGFSAAGEANTLKSVVDSGLVSYEKVSEGSRIIGISCSKTDVEYLVTLSGSYLPTAKSYVESALPIFAARNQIDNTKYALELLADISRIITFNKHDIFSSSQAVLTGPIFPWPSEFNCQNMVSSGSGLVNRINELAIRLAQ